MMRKHGWQLPAHTLQVVAITVFCLLVVAFNAFLAPFLGGHIWEYALVAIYSPVALLVLFLYVRCTAINPADPGILSKFDHRATNETGDKLSTSTRDVPGRFDELATDAHSSPISMSKSSIVEGNLSKLGSTRGDTEVNNLAQQASKMSFCNTIRRVFCAPFVHEDCYKRGEFDEQEVVAEDALYCTLCNALVRKHSKHCRSCNKCVDGFDHHCRWLNNCVGRRNYMTFIFLMAASLIWLVIEAGVGIAVFVRCFVYRRGMEAEIVDRLGNGFSRAPFTTVVAICTTVSVIACVPLCELLFFHMILIRKGITTYEYVLAMRTMSETEEAIEVRDLPAGLFSRTSSTTTGFSGGSSLGLPNKGAWCTPPRVFVDYQEEVVPHLEPGMVPSTTDPDATAHNKVKRPVRISAWKLAKLDSNEAVKAAARARASSSVLRPVDNRPLPASDYSSSENVSIQSSVSTDLGANKDIKNDLRLSSMRNSLAPSQGSQDEYETGTQTVSSFSSPSHVHESVTLSPLPKTHGSSHPNAASFVPGFASGQPSTSRAHLNINPVTSFASALDEKKMQKESSTEPLLLSAPTAFLRDVRRTSVVWDDEAGRYVSVPTTTSITRAKPSQQISLSKANAETSSHNKKTAIQAEESSSGTAKAPNQQSNKLMYSGESIFFGGPLLGIPSRDGVKAELGSIFRQGQDRLIPNLSRESRFKRDTASNQLPVFVPGSAGGSDFR